MAVEKQFLTVHIILDIDNIWGWRNYIGIPVSNVGSWGTARMITVDLVYGRKFGKK